MLFAACFGVAFIAYALYAWRTGVVWHRSGRYTREDNLRMFTFLCGFYLGGGVLVLLFFFLELYLGFMEGETLFEMLFSKRLF